MAKHTGIEFAENALLPKWDKYTYDRLDCQRFDQIDKNRQEWSRNQVT